MGHRRRGTSRVHDCLEGMGCISAWSTLFATYRSRTHPLLANKGSALRSQARWLDEIQSYDFDVEHVSGKSNVVPDALSRRKDHSPILSAIQLVADDFLIKVSVAYNTDEWSLAIIKALEDENTEPDVSVAKHVITFAYDGKFIHWIGSNESRVFVPKVGTLRADIIPSFHDVAHLGIEKPTTLCRTYCTRDFTDS